MDRYIPMPERLTSAPFLLRVENVYSISGRGTVVDGLHRARCGARQRRSRNRGFQADDQGDVHQHRDLSRGSSMKAVRATTLASCFAVSNPTKWNEARFSRARKHHAAQALRVRGVRADEGGRRPAYALSEGLRAAVLLPHERSDRCDDVAGRCQDGDAGCHGEWCRFELLSAIAMEVGQRFAIREGNKTSPSKKKGRRIETRRPFAFLALRIAYQPMSLNNSKVRSYGTVTSCVRSPLIDGSISRFGKAPVS